MEPREGDKANFSADKEISGINADRLSAAIAGGIKMRLLDETTSTYHNQAGGIGRNCFLTTPDRNKSLDITYWSTNRPDVTDESVSVDVIDRTSNPPSGYHLILRPSSNEAWIRFSPTISNLDIADATDIFEAAYGITFDECEFDDEGNLIGKGHIPSQEYEEQTKDKGNLRKGLLLIQELLATAHPDDVATTVSQEWLESTPEYGTKIRNGDEITALLPTVAADIDTSLASLPEVVNKAFSEEDINQPKEEG